MGTPIRIDLPGKISWQDAPLSAKLLIAANLVPILGVMLGGWKITEVLFLYWFESAIVGAFNILKFIFLPIGDKLQSVGRFLAIPFFCFHYGMFMYVHGIFLSLMSVQFKLIGPDVRLEDFIWSVRYAILALIISHGYSFFTYYLKEERYSLNVQKLMEQPYSRILVMHISILLGFFGVMMFGQPLVLLLLFIVLKTITDFSAHLNQHKQQVPAGAAGANIPSTKETVVF